MILVIGNTPQKVELHDLSDSVYYKQQKVFSDAQIARSKDLARALKAGTLTVLRRMDEKSGSFDIPTSGIPDGLSADLSSKKIDILLDRIKNLEEVISKSSSQPAQAPPQAPAQQISSQISQRIEKLEKDLSSKGDNSKAFEALYGAVERLEKKLEKTSQSDELLQKLDSILKRRGGREEEDIQRSADEVYIPSVTVEDARSHINLDVRKIEKSDNVTESLKKLKELKKLKSKSK